MRPVRLSRPKAVAAASAVLASLALAGPALAATTTAQARSAATPAAKPVFHVKQILTGMKLWHSFIPAGSTTRQTEHLTKPDDITMLGRYLFTAFQNGVGPQGEPSTADGNTDSTVVEFTTGGHVIHKWDLHGKARVANLGASRGKKVQLALTDPDSNEVVPATAARFAGDFMLTSQGDQEQIYLRPYLRGWSATHSLRVLALSQSVDDTAWARGRGGSLFGSDNGGDTIDMVTGPFRPGMAIVAVTPCGANNAPATCPAAGFPANYLGVLNPWTGHIATLPVAGPAFTPQGLVFAG
jgi:type IV secretory pathway VirB2 component (pilin)